MDKVYSFVADKIGVRLDKFVGEECSALSRTQAQKLINSGYITVNDRVTKLGFKLNIGDRVDIIIPPIASTSLSPEAIPVSIIYEDDDLLVVDKPSGLAVHPAPGHPNHTLVNAILPHLSGLAEASDSLRPGVVHRQRGQRRRWHKCGPRELQWHDHQLRDRLRWTVWTPIRHSDWLPVHLRRSARDSQGGHNASGDPGSDERQLLEPERPGPRFVRTAGDR